MTPLARRVAAFGFTLFVLEALERIPHAGLGFDPEVADRMEVPLTIGWIGLAPWLTAFLLVEVAARLVPAWRPLRTAGRDRLFRAVVLLWLLLASLQSFGLAVSLEKMSLGFAPLVLEPGWGFRLTTMATLVAGSAAVGAISFWNHRHGLGTGLALAWAVSFLLEPLQWWHAVQIGEVVLLMPVLIAASGLAMASARTPRGLRLTPAGLVPLIWVPGLVVTMTQFFPSFTSITEATLLGIVATTVLLSLLHFPGRLQQRRQEFSLAIVVNAAWAGGLAWLALERGAPTWGVGLIVLPTVALDLFAELQARRDGLDHEVARFHHVGTAETALTSLQAAGIDAALRGDRTRCLLHFFGPYLPIGLLVASVDRERAEAALSS